MTSAGEVLGRRSVETNSEPCDALDPQLVLILALAIAPEATDVAGPPVPTVASSHPLSLAAQGSAATADSARPSSPVSGALARGRLAVALSASSAGLVPSTAPGVSFAAGFDLSRGIPARLVTASFWPEDAYGSKASVGASFSLWTLSALVCPLNTGTRVVALACGGLDGGLLRVDSFGLEGSRHSLAGVFGGVLRGEIDLQLSERWGVTLAGSLKLSPFRQRMTYTDGDGVVRDLFRTGGVSGVVEVGPMLLLP